MNEQNNTTRGGIGFVGLLTILFIALKLTGYIDWAWVWVLSPLWISAIVGIVLFLILFVFPFAIAMIVDGRRRK